MTNTNFSTSTTGARSTTKQDLIAHLRKNSQYENAFDENRAIQDLYAGPELTERQGALMFRLYEASRYENNLDEHRLLVVVL